MHTLYTPLGYTCTLWMLEISFVVYVVCKKTDVSDAECLFSPICKEYSSYYITEGSRVWLDMNTTLLEPK